MQGAPLHDTIACGTPIRDAALFGMHGAHVNCTDGRYVYMRASATEANEPLHNYTLMPTHMRSRFSTSELQDVELVPPFAFTKGCPVLKIQARSWVNPYEFGTLLFDLQRDPSQQYPMSDPAIEETMIEHMVRLMRETDAPPEQFERLGLPH
jgi:hypothetical protein